ncbi:MAG: hypothetical protein ACLQJR_10950, partial [Stellaceae bacterium]
LRRLNLLPTSKAIPEISKGQKLVMGSDGRWSLEPDLERFQKGSRGLDLVRTHLAGRHLMKRAADLTPITPEEMLGGTPQVAPFGRPRTSPGLSDADVQTLEQEVVAPLTIDQQSRMRDLATNTYRIVAANPGRRLSTSTDSYGVAPDGRAGNFTNAAAIVSLVKAAMAQAIKPMNAELAAARVRTARALGA